MGILTWPDLSYPYLHLYYAWLDNQGNVLAGPTIYRQARGSVIYASSRGHGVGRQPPYRLYLPPVLLSRQGGFRYPPLALI